MKPPNVDIVDIQVFQTPRRINPSTLVIITRREMLNLQRREISTRYPTTKTPRSHVIWPLPEMASIFSFPPIEWTKIPLSMALTRRVENISVCMRSVNQDRAEGYISAS